MPLRCHAFWGGGKRKAAALLGMPGRRFVEFDVQGAHTGIGIVVRSVHQGERQVVTSAGCAHARALRVHAARGGVWVCILRVCVGVRGCTCGARMACGCACVSACWACVWHVAVHVGAGCLCACACCARARSWCAHRVLVCALRALGVRTACSWCAHRVLVCAPCVCMCVGARASVRARVRVRM